MFFNDAHRRFAFGVAREYLPKQRDIRFIFHHCWVFCCQLRTIFMRVEKWALGLLSREVRARWH